MTILKPPTKVNPDLFHKKFIFLAGSIEQGTAEEWQQRCEKVFDQLPKVVVLNPRRDVWDPNLKQDISEPVFNEQVNWELDGIAMSDLVFMYFDPNTKSPITLAELGFTAGAQIPTVVVCPPGFWRRGNVQIMCQRAGFELFDDLTDGIQHAIEKLMG